MYTLEPVNSHCTCLMVTMVRDQSLAAIRVQFCADYVLSMGAAESHSLAYCCLVGSQSVVWGPRVSRGSMAGSQSVVWGPLGVHDGFPRGSMAGSQSVVQDLWGSLRGFQGGPWLVSNKCNSVIGEIV